MKSFNILCCGAFIFVFNAICATPSLAIDTPSEKENVNAVDFVNEASVNGIAEVEAAKLALQQAKSDQVKTFAQQVIDGHMASNKDLAAIAKKKNLKIADEAELWRRAKLSMLVKQGDNESFDEAYIKSQVKAHQDEIELFNKAAVSRDVELAGFATENIPKLQHHLHFAEQLAKDFEKKE